MTASAEMHGACTKLYLELAAVDTLAKQVQDLRQSVDKLEANVTAKLQANKLQPGSPSPN